MPLVRHHYHAFDVHGIAQIQQVYAFFLHGIGQTHNAFTWHWPDTINTRISCACHWPGTIDTCILPAWHWPESGSAALGRTDQPDRPLSPPGRVWGHKKCIRALQGCQGLLGKSGVKPLQEKPRCC